MNLAVAYELYAGGPGSGCQGSNCGRPMLYHGTSWGRATNILRRGLKADYGRGAYLTSEKHVAHRFGKLKIGGPDKRKFRGYAIVTVDPAHVKLVKDREFSGEAAFKAKEGVPKSAIRSVEWFDRYGNFVKATEQ